MGTLGSNSSPSSSMDDIIDKKEKQEKKSQVSTISKMSFSEVSNNTTASDCEDETNWRAVIIASVVTFIAAIENTVVGMSEWPYMNQIDKEADAQFFGNATAASKLFHALGALVFAIWCQKSQSFRIPLVVGRFIAFGACLLYLCVEYLTHGRRYLMAVCYVLFGVAASSSTILRAYVAAISHTKDRPQAYSGLQAAIMVSIIVGPLIQAIFSGIAYPGFEILPNVKFHIYSAPVWVAALTNFISIAIICVFLRELPRRARSTMRKNKSLMTFQGIKTLMEKISAMNLNWRIVVLCWLQKMNSTLSIVTLTTLTSIIFMTNYGWGREYTVLVMSVTMAAVGIFAVGITLLYFICRLGDVLRQRFAFLIGVIIFLCMYILAYPWKPISFPVFRYNATEDLGCNPTVYSWCDTSYAAIPGILLTVIALVMGIGIPLSMVALDSIYSKVLGDIDQSVFQGAMIVAEDVILVFGPIYTSGVYTHFGFETLWTCNGIIVAVGALLWIYHLRRLKPYS